MALYRSGVTLEGDADAVVHTQLVQALNNLLAEESSIHAQLDFCLRTGCLHPFNTPFNALFCTVTIMNVTATMLHGQYSRRLCNRAIQWLVAALALLLLVKSFGHTFCMATGSEHRAIQINRDCGKLLASRCINDHILLQARNATSTTIIHCAQLPSDGGHCRHTMQPDQTQYHRIILEELNITQTSVSKATC